MTSEEKLLQLIRKQDESAKKQAQKGKKDAKKKSTAQGGGFFKTANKMLMMGSVGILLFMGYAYLKTDTAVDDGSMPDKRSLPGKTDVSTEAVEARPFSEYRDRYRQRDLFEYPWTKSEPSQGQEVSTEVVQAMALQSRLHIVGIVLDENSKAIIEDSQIGQTFFVSVGEEIAGAVVEDINEEKVTLKYNNERVELTR